jgi:hypothetical protein
MRVDNGKRKKARGPQTHIHGNVYGPVLSGEFHGPVKTDAATDETAHPQLSEQQSSAPSIVFNKEVRGAVFNFGPQQGIVSTGDGASISQLVSTAATGLAGPMASTSGQVQVPDFQSKPELTAFLQDWVRTQWKTGAGGGTGRSGNVLLKARWRGQPALLKVSADADGLRAEAAHLAALRAPGVGLSVARLFACAEAIEGDDRWMAYLMEPVGEMSLRDYLFTATPSPGKIIESLGQGLTALYCRTARPTTRDFVAEYVKVVRQSLEKARGYATFVDLAPHFESGMAVKGVALVGPGSILQGLEERLQRGDAGLRALNPARDCHVHGDLHFENVRINPADAALGLHWLIDPKEFDRSDYVYDLAKLVTSLTGHAHADIGENETGNPRLKWTDAEDGRIDFNCVLTPRQVQGWREGLAAIETLAVNVAPHLEMAGASGSADAEAIRRMKQRLLLALARHFFSAVRFFLQPEAQWLLFARGTQFLAMFQEALEGIDENKWDPFRVCAEDRWLETV